MTVRAFIVPVKILLTLLITYFAHEPVSTVLCYMPLPIALYCELEAALIANKGFNTPKKGKKLTFDVQYWYSELTCEISYAAPGEPPSGMLCYRVDI